MRNKLIPVIEIFGPTVQGEGMVVGQKTMFVRTAGCDFSCSWCDSAFTWDGSGKSEIKLMSPLEIWEELYRLAPANFSHVTISGGNPALYPQMEELIDFLHEKKVKVAIETQGSRYQSWLTKVDDLTISPKPPSSGMTHDLTILDRIMDEVTKEHSHSHPSLKVVIFDEQDLAFAKDIHKRYEEVPFYVQVGNSLVNESDNDSLVRLLLERYEWLIDEVMKDEELLHVRVLPQLHTLVWGNKRGV